MGYDGNKKILSEQEQERQRQQERTALLNDLWHGYLEVCGNQANHAKNAMKKVTGKEASKDYTDEDFNALFEDLARRQAELAKAEQEQQETTQEAVDVDYNEEAQA